MNRKIGLVIIVLAVALAIMSVFGKLSSDNLINVYSNETGTCYADGTCLHEQSNILFIALGIVAAVLFAVGFVIFLFYGKKETANKEVAKVIDKEKTPSLTSQQKIIYDILKEAGTPMLQGELVSKSGMNKVTVSRTLDKMEMMGVIERRRHGMSNLVILKV
jgi:uncharacterized membrane protein